MTQDAAAVLVELEVNGEAVAARVDPRTLLVEFLRAHLGLTGTHVGCDTSQCGACTVNLDGLAVKSCTVLAAQAAGGKVITVEGLAAQRRNAAGFHPVQQAFIDCHGLQCGFCTPSMIMAIDHYLRQPAEDIRLDEESICTALEGNICRCTGYVNIIAAVRKAALELHPGLAASPPPAHEMNDAHGGRP
ncbi:MAG: (2Fe-2S)-binding protein [Candidatus Protistobacter heckmanni]|nr:(2Fe-2S)-binding protein [Candidatus Protistobacter heckmanni]